MSLIVLFNMAVTRLIPKQAYFSPVCKLVIISRQGFQKSLMQKRVEFANGFPLLIPAIKMTQKFANAFCVGATKQIVYRVSGAHSGRTACIKVY